MVRCDKCSRVFGSSRALITHSRFCDRSHVARDGDREQKSLEVQSLGKSRAAGTCCTKCGQSFASTRALSTHLRFCKRNAPESQSDSDGDSNGDSDSGSDDDADCPRCGRSFSSARALQAHSRFCKVAAEECPKCGRSFSSGRAMRTHYSRFCKDTAKSVSTDHEETDHSIHVQCQQCEESFASTRALSTHLRFCKGKGIAPESQSDSDSDSDSGSDDDVDCPKCGRSFLSARALQTHSRFCKGGVGLGLSDEASFHEQADTRNASFLCGKCHRHFGSTRALGAHTRFCAQKMVQGQSTSDEENIGKTFLRHPQCADCDRMFRSRRALQSHRRFCKQKRRDPTTQRSLSEGASAKLDFVSDSLDRAADSESDFEDDGMRCARCNRIFGSIRGLKTHSRFCKGVEVPSSDSDESDIAAINSNNQHRCAACGQDFSSTQGSHTHTCNGNTHTCNGNGNLAAERDKDQPPAKKIKRDRTPCSVTLTEVIATLREVWAVFMASLLVQHLSLT